MGDDNEVQLRYNFLHHRDAAELFGKLDFQLKDGVHFQSIEGQFDYFNFIQENEDSLSKYYNDFFGVDLTCGGEGQDRYYYLEFNGVNRGAIDADHRTFLRNDFVIVGLLIYKIIFIDRNLELSSLKTLQHMIRKDYEDLKPDLYRLLARARKESPSQVNDERVDEIVRSALIQFSKIGWVSLQDDTFDVHPSFQRLNKLYADYINNIDTIIKQMSA